MKLPGTVPPKVQNVYVTPSAAYGDLKKEVQRGTK
jgi:hypothetical protein